MILQRNAPIEQFKQFVLGNPTLQKGLSQATDRHSFVGMAVAAGREHGLSFSAADLNGVIDQQQAASGNDLWLNDELLESVAGNQATPNTQKTCSTCSGCPTVSTLGCHTGKGCK